MVGSDENDAGVIRASNLQGGSRARGGKIITETVANRRALSAIDENIIGAEPYPFAVHKRSAFAEKNANVASKNPKIPVHRPITRQYAAQIASKQQPIDKGTKLPVSSASQRNEPKDCTIIDVDDYKANSDKSLLMHLQHTEAMPEENDQMDDDIEMESVEECLIVNIDIPDKKNALAVVEYIDDIHTFYKKTECLSCVTPDYMDLQPDINERMRGILIDWLIEVHYKFELMDETLYLTVNLIDRFLAAQPVVRKKLQLVGVTAMLLSCKYEEVSVPVVEDFILVSDKAYCRKEVLDMEKLMINTLQFNMSVPTPYVFMRRFLKAAQSDKKLECTSSFMIDLCLVEYQMLRFPPSKLAAAAIFTAQCTLTGCKQWSGTCEKYTSYTQDQLLECSKLMVTFHQKVGSGKLTGVHQKYSTSKFGYAAKSEPAVFLSDA